MLKLKKITIEDKDPVLDFIESMRSHDSDIHGLWFSDAKDFETMITSLKAHESVAYEGYEQAIPMMHQYLLMEAQACVGVVSIRPYLTRALDESFGGHIGYSIRPEARRKGYGTQALKLAIEEMRVLGSTEAVIVCCAKDNKGSQTIIKSCGGILIDATDLDEKYIIEN